MNDELISIRQAAAQGIERLRKPIWRTPEDHLKIDIHPDGTPGIWVHLYCPFNLQCNGRDPIDMLLQLECQGAYDERCWLPYTGPLPDSTAYRAAVQEYEEARKRVSMSS